MSPCTKQAPTVAIGSLLVLGCPFTETNPDHCNNNDGDAYCARLAPDGALPYCETGKNDCITPGHERYGCVADRPTDACYSPCGGRSNLAENAECQSASVTTEATTTSPTTDPSTTDPSTTDPSTTTPSTDGTTGPMPCAVDEDCAEPMPPFCDTTSGECVTCDAFGASADAKCAALHPMTPLCVRGVCVPCTPENPAACDEELLLCDGATNTCIPCTEHGQCTSGACELAVGRCFPSDAVRWEVDGDGTADHSSIAMAVNAVNDGAHGVIVVHQLNGGATYGPAVINMGKIIALLAAPGELPVVQSVIGTPDLRISGMGTTLYADGLSLSGNPAGFGLLVESDALAWIDRSRIVQNSGGGIRAQSNAALTLRNSFVGGAIDDDAVFVQNATIDILYSTIAANFGISRALACEGSSTATIRNSLLVSLDIADEVQCPGVIASHTASEELLPGMGNVALGEVSMDWFTDYASGDFHLDEPPIEVVSAARWEMGDPRTDIDADPRPRRDGAPDFAGADVP